jgi:Tol biopolymer transport system component
VLAGATLAAFATAQPADPAIAYYGYIKAQRMTGIAVCNADGTNARVIHSTSASVRAFSWSPDGTSIAYLTLSPLEVWRINVSVVNGVPQGSNATRLLGGDGYTYGVPAWSPLGDVILSNRKPFNAPDTENVLVTVPAAGGAATVIYQPPIGAMAAPATWSPDATRIAFAEHPPGGGGAAPDIFVLELATGIKTMVMDAHPGGVWPRYLEWARTRDALAFEDFDAGGVYTLDINVGAPVLVT